MPTFFLLLLFSGNNNIKVGETRAAFSSFCFEVGGGRRDGVGVGAGDSSSSQQEKGEKEIKLEKIISFFFSFNFGTENIAHTADYEYTSIVARKRDKDNKIFGHIKNLRGDSRTKYLVI